ncbi:MAG: type II secretion system F family protein [Candidatus Undinarchaeales archaeon]|jgi:flagellar protein FlaJ|nr:type II secretion system F family protein [Candidatus Undinarchaeales archaeon]MDP7494325.1 type II secretion system F family protein [Candidatus Undinarchaeales archaeon]
MSFAEEYLRFSYSLFGSLVESYGSSLADIRNDLRKASIRLTAEEYVSAAIMSSLILPILLLVPTGVLMILLDPFAPNTIIIVAFGAVFGWTFMFVAVLTMFYIYPAIIVSGKKKSIDNILPFATTYLATMAGSGMPPQNIFKIMSKFDQYGDVSQEAKLITRDIEIFGMDVPTALERASGRQASEQFKDLLWDIKDTITTGGDLKILLHEKSREYMNVYRRSLDSYVEQLSMLVEMYITVVIVGSVFFVVMSAVMTVMGGGDIMPLLQKGMLIMLPLAADGFIVMVMTMSPVAKADSTYEILILGALTFVVIIYVVVST